jgi:hypothetical protein
MSRTLALAVHHVPRSSKGFTMNLDCSEHHKRWTAFHLTTRLHHQ